MNKVPALKPLTMYTHGVSQVFYRVAGGNRTYFLGNVSINTADPRYFPTVFLIKTPLIYLFLYALTGVLLLLFLLRGLHSAHTDNIKLLPQIIKTKTREHFTEVSLFGFILFYAVVAVSSNLTIGLRHLFPLFAPLYLFTAIILVRAVCLLQQHASKRMTHITITVLVIGITLNTLLAYPHYLAYFNIIGGGAAGGYHTVADSNADWGQATKELLIWVDNNDVQKINIDYFGGDNLDYRFGDRHEPWWDARRPVEPGYYAISATFLQDSLHSGKDPNESYAWTRNLEPLTVIGGSLVIYHIQ